MKWFAIKAGYYPQALNQDAVLKITMPF